MNNSKITWEQAVLAFRNNSINVDAVLACYYDDPLIDAAKRYWHSEEWRALRSLLPVSHGKALDVGAGRGIASFALAKEGFSVTALEPDSSALVGAEAIKNLAQASGLAIEVTQEFSEKLPFADQTFDVVFARAVLHHTKDLPAACAEFFRVLKPGGRLIAVREHVISKASDLPAFLDAHPLHKLYGGENAFLLSEYQAAIKLAGFNLKHTFSPFESAINYSPYTLDSLRREVTQRIARKLPLVAESFYTLLSIDSVWFVARKLLDVVDNRPGRLYSFFAERP